MSVTLHLLTLRLLRYTLINSLIHKELPKVAEMALDLSAEFRQFDTNKKSAEFSRKIVAEN